MAGNVVKGTVSVSASVRGTIASSTKYDALNARLTAEISRATAAEEALSEEIDEKIAEAAATKADLTALATEVERAATAEAAMQEDIENLQERVSDLESGAQEIIESSVETTIQEMIDSGEMAALTIEDGSISREKVDADFEATLAKADGAMQKSVYDPEGYGDLETPVDPYSYAADYADDVKDALLGTTAFTVTDSDVTQTSTIYTGIRAALNGVLNRAELYSIAVSVVEELPESPSARTIYLIAKDGGGYEKWWYVNGAWDKFGASSTEVVAELPEEGDEDVDYILEADGGYYYYKYIDDTWVMIAGGSAEVLGYNSTEDAYNSYLFGSGAPSADTATEEYYTDSVIYLNIANMDYYTVAYSGGEYSWVRGGSLVASPSETKDYYVQDSNNSWAHFRYISSMFVQIGSSSYTRDQINALLDDINDDIDDIKSDMSAAQSNISTLQAALANLDNTVKDVTVNEDGDELTIAYVDGSTETLTLSAGADLSGYSATYDENEDNYLRFYDEEGTELENLAVYITGGGGGSGSGSVTIGRVTDASVQCVYGDDVTISYTCAAKDASGDATGDGTGTLYVNNIAVKTGFAVSTSTTGTNNSIDVSDYLTVGNNTIKISVSVDTGGETNTVASKTWTVNAINMYLTWSYTDSQVNTSAVTDYYTPYGAVEKTIYTFIDVNPVGFNPEIVTELPDAADADENVDYFLYDESEGTYTHYVYDADESDFVTADGELLDVNVTSRSGVQQALVIPMQTHGSHAVVRYVSATINGEVISTAQQVHDMIFVVSGTSTPIVAVSFNTATMTQYNTAQIPIVIYDPLSTTATAILAEDGTTVSTWTGVDRTLHYWNYSPSTYGNKTLTISCTNTAGTTTKTINIAVEEIDIDEAEVTGYDFRFKASEMATNAAVQAWSASYTPVGGSAQTVSLTFSNNFDWVNGGLHTEYDDNGHLRQYLCVRAGTTMTINYPLFGQNYDPKQYGKAFKFIFKAANCRTYDASVLTCKDTANGNNGVGLVMTANECVLTTTGESLNTYYCKDSYVEFELNIHPTSEYRYLQFWMDGSHDRTILYSASDTMQQTNPVGITIGSADCDVYVYMIKAYPTYLSNDNMLSNFIMDAPNAYDMVDRYDRNNILNASGEVDYDLLATQNPDLHVILLDLERMSTGKKDNAVAHTFRHIYNSGGQSECFTVSNACVTIQGTSSVGYLESAGNVDVNYKYGRTFTSDNTDYTTGSILFDDGTTSTSGYSISDDAIAVDYLNIKLNVASSENANNACIADWYNTYQPWTSPARAKNANARDTVEFVPGAIFIRDRSGDLWSDGDTSGYHFYGICDIGNSKKNTAVFHDTTNPLACCVEVSNNTSAPCLMSDDTYTWDDDKAVVTSGSDSVTVFEFRYVDDDSLDICKAAWDRFVSFMTQWNPNNATGAALESSVTFGNYTFSGSGSYDTSAYDDDNVVYLYGYGLPAAFNNGLYDAASYVTDATAETSYYYIDYSTGYIYSSDGTSWTALTALTWTADSSSVLAGTTISAYAGTYTTDSFNYRMAHLLAHCEEYMIIDPVIYHFVFIESYLMTDNVAKNTFWSSDDGVHWEPCKDYDNDTALGNDNVGGA